MMYGALISTKTLYSNDIELMSSRLSRCSTYMLVFKVYYKALHSTQDDLTLLGYIIQ